MGSLLLFAFACGGKVVVDGNSASGAGGAGPGGGNGAGGAIVSTGDVDPASVASSSTGGTGVCDQDCAKNQTKGCSSGAACVAECEKAFAAAGACKPQLDAVYQCLLMSTDSSCTPAECAELVKLYESCVSPKTCTSPTCTASDMVACDCMGFCGGATLEMKCTAQDLTDYCECFKDGAAVAMCTQPKGGPAPCDVVKGCCAATFFP